MKRVFEVVISRKNQGCCDFILKCVVVVLRGDRVCSLRVGLQLVFWFQCFMEEGEATSNVVVVIGSVESCVVTGKSV